MSELSEIALVREMLDSAEKSIRSARKILADVSGETLPSKSISSDQLSKLPKATTTESGRVIEGMFDGQNMQDAEGNTFPIPANYASKSKLVVGDLMKLTISPEGRFIYKSIGPVERKTIRGALTYEDGRYKVLADGKAYNVLLASVTFCRAEVGDEIAAFVPAEKESDWAAIDAVIP
ncbi:hypothetical protein HZA38_02240 [Candidatus Peregrinibacteria bacterium]|nr:hypothetical protein [Candidatus Peregrinibacteria bacterium]